MNLYTYVQNNPVNTFDPYGLVGWGHVVGGGAAIIGGGINMGAGGALMIGAGGEVESLAGAPFAAHTFGTGALLFVAGAIEMNYGMETLVNGLLDWDRKHKELMDEDRRKGEQQANEQFDDMQRKYDKINEWLEKRSQCP